MRVNAYSIVARFGWNGELGPAIASAAPAVGPICLRLRPMLGAVSTQSWVNPYLADAALNRMAAGDSAMAALAAVIAAEPAAVVEMLLKSPADRPGGGGARPP